MFEPLDRVLLAHLTQVAKVNGGDLTMPAPTTGNPEVEQGAIPNPFQTFASGGKHSSQPGQGDRSLLARVLASIARNPGRMTEHGTNRQLLAGIGKVT
ncbi:TPA: hypothetical protein ACJ509_002226 [Stenotrophomonas maltophilia]